MRTDSQLTGSTAGGPSSREATNGMPHSQARGLAGARPSNSAAPIAFETFLPDSATSTVASESSGALVRSVTVNAVSSDRVVQNQSPLSEPPTSVGRVIRESYGRVISARSRRFDAHA